MHLDDDVYSGFGALGVRVMDPATPKRLKIGMQGRIVVGPVF